MKRKKKTSPAAAPRDLEEVLGYRFGDSSLLERALIHRSHAHERGRPQVDNEALEFLGDSVLALGVSWLLHDRFTGAQVGDLARTRAYLVSATNLARKARRLDLGRFLKLGRGEERGGGRDKSSLLADAYEAVLAAVFLDGGLDAALDVLRRHFTSQIARIKPGSRSEQDHKTDLQEKLQAAGLPVPRYKVVAEEGPDHRRRFSVELLSGGHLLARGRGLSKKAAGQRAARAALKKVDALVEKLKEKA